MVAGPTRPTVRSPNRFPLAKRLERRPDLPRVSRPHRARQRKSPSRMGRDGGTPRWTAVLIGRPPKCKVERDCADCAAASGQTEHVCIPMPSRGNRMLVRIMGLMVLLAASVAFAHHSFAMFNMQQDLVLQGVA